MQMSIVVVQISHNKSIWLDLENFLVRNVMRKGKKANSYKGLERGSSSVRSAIHLENKIRLINACLSKDPVDLTTLRQISIESGLINHGLRKKVWPKLLAIDVENTSHFLEENYSLNADSDQVRRDIDRSLWKFTYGNAALRKKKREELSRIINGILHRHPQLHYYQGFHDICSVFVIICGEREAFAIMEKLSLFYIRSRTV